MSELDQEASSKQAELFADELGLTLVHGMVANPVLVPSNKTNEYLPVFKVKWRDSKGNLVLNADLPADVYLSALMTAVKAVTRTLNLYKERGLKADFFFVDDDDLDRLVSEGQDAVTSLPAIIEAIRS